MTIHILLIIFFVFAPVFNEAKDKQVDAELIAEIESIQPGQAFWIALKLKAQPDWHTYWRNPGDSGLPTTIKWHLPEGFKHSEINWPVPHLFIVEGISNFGYDNEELLLVKITPPKNLAENKTITIKAQAKWLACKIACIPGEENLSLTLPVKNEKPVANKKTKKQIEETLFKLPGKKSDIKLDAELKENSIIISGNGNFNELENVRFFPYEAGYYNNSAEQKLIQKENRFTLQILLDDFKIGNPKNVYGILYNENGWEKENRKSIEVNLKLNN